MDIILQKWIMFKYYIYIFFFTFQSVCVCAHVCLYVLKTHSNDECGGFWLWVTLTFLNSTVHQLLPFSVCQAVNVYMCVDLSAEEYCLSSLANPLKDECPCVSADKWELRLSDSSICYCQSVFVPQLQAAWLLLPPLCVSVCGFKSLQL